MTVVLRSDGAPPPATLLIHMGAGAVESVVSAALRNYGEYRTLTPDRSGLFAVSVFAVAGGVTEAEILGALPQRAFARASVRTVTDAGFDLLPTSIVDADMDAAITAIQRVHYDIVLPAIHDVRFAALDPLDDESLETAGREHLRPYVGHLLALFGDRRRK